MKKHLSALGNIYTGSVNDGLSAVIDSLMPSSVILIADENTAALCVPHINYITADSHIIVIPAGEMAKNIHTCQSIWSSLIQKGADRDSIILNVGGGMVCDIGGFAASCYQRGIRFGHIPTSVLAIADAAIGGKTGIDFEGLKNYIGTFRVPSFIWIDEDFLETLPAIEKISGLAEIVKHAIIADKDLFDLLSEIQSIDKMPWKEVFEKNFPIKLKICEADPEEKGIRKILNFGHTIGHALESYFMNSSLPVSHGQCVALGILCESKISNELGLLNNIDFKAIEKVVDQLLDPVKITIPTFNTLEQWIRRDKKKKDGQTGFSLPDRLGSCGWDIPVQKDLITGCLEWLSQDRAMTER
jgi:3-dehydroquinate synthase